MENRIEEWMDIPDCGGLYQASSLGRIKSLRYGKDKILKASRNNNGYLKVNIWQNKKSITKYVHRLVAAAFFGAIPNDMTVNHKDFNKENNSIENLEVVTYSYNLLHALRNNRRKEYDRSGEKNGRSKLTEHEVDYIRGLHISVSDMAKMMGVSRAVIYSIRNYKTWKHV